MLDRDEQAELERLRAQEADRFERDRKRAAREIEIRRWFCWGVAWLGGVLVFAFWVMPWDDDAVAHALYQDLGVGAILSGLAVAVGTNLVLEQPRLRTLHFIVGAAVPAVIFGVWGALLQPRHEKQVRTVDAFERYTHRFPRDVLSAPWLIDHSKQVKGGDYKTVCADHQRGQRKGMTFCVEVDLDRAEGRQNHRRLSLPRQPVRLHDRLLRRDLPMRGAPGVFPMGRRVLSDPARYAGRRPNGSG